ncbi:hypothetical protein [Micrococcus sp.]|uniref:hypothetical protein n=1 Tax=Micrococcus sp. TaxID=1271 RepID=UPI002A91A382|nr:hypothetical protein [Micrococcus sp.]MDY6055588.1 hypothetical protein [Micrococcus sp.]
MSIPAPASPSRPALRGRRVLAMAVAAVASAALLSGCASDDAEAHRALESAQERLDSVESRVAELEDEVDRKMDLGDLEARANEIGSEAARRAQEAWEGARAEVEGRVQGAVDSLPGLPDAEDVQALEDQGRVVIDYARDALSQDPAELERQAREAAERAREALPDLRGVEIRVGDQTFSF